MEAMGKRTTILALAAAVALCGGCTLKQYAHQADSAAYRAVAGGQVASLGRSEPFDVNYSPYATSAGTEDEHHEISIGSRVVPLGGDSELVPLTATECLLVAFRNSRDLQDRKEDVYSRALELANLRRGWDVPLFAGAVSGEISHETDENVPVVQNFEVPDPSDPPNTKTYTRLDNDTQEESSASAGLEASLTQRFVNGGELILAATLDWALDLIPAPGADRNNSAVTVLKANFTQPLLRGAWRGLAYEPQYRLERDFLFAVYDYARFRETFAATVYSGYYAVLTQRDQLENARMSIERQKTTLAVTKVQVEGGMLSRVDEDRAEQALLSAQISYEQSVQSYNNALDRYKIVLGLPVEARVDVDYPAALNELKTVGPRPVGLDESQAVAVALATRPDVLTQEADVRDAARDVEIAADNFLPQVDVELGISAQNDGPRDFQNVRFDRNQRVARLTFDYQLDQTDNRDDYRLSMIAFDRSRRDLSRFLDNVVLDVRSAYRQLVQSKETYELNERSVEIATRRHRLAQLQQKEGELSPVDVLDAESDLLNAENGRTSALVSYNNTRMAFLADLGFLAVDEEGIIHERTQPFTFDRIGRYYPYVEGH
jgi:outer membrane protein TolC